jgi:tetratricopeptide (TPR) repeat protein
MKKQITLPVFLILFALLPSVAQNVTIDYIDGYLDVMERGSWVEAYIGDTLSASDSVRLDEDSYAELSGRNLNLTLTSPGIYRISELISAAGEGNSLGVGNLVAGKLSLMLQGGSSQVQSAVGGVRASEAVAAPKLDWMGSDTAELIKEAQDALRENRFDSAQALLEEAYDLALDDQEESEALFYLGWTLYQKGETAEALKRLTTVQPDSYSSTYHSHFLITGNILVSTFAYDEAIAWFNDYDPSAAAFQDTEAEQAIYLLYGMAFKQKGQSTQAREVLQKSLDLNPSGDTAAAARTLLDEL